MTGTMQRRLAAIFAADVVGFSRLMGAAEEDTLTRLKSLRATLVDIAIATHGGRIFKTTGDGLLAEFPSVVAAVKCAAEVQIAMAARYMQEPAESRIVYRIGVNLGDVMVEGDDIFGDGVNIAARIESICRPGAVAISASAYEQVRDKIEFPLIDCGEHLVKNIARPIHVYGLDLSAHGVAAAGAVPQKAETWVRLRGRLPLLLVVAALAGAVWFVYVQTAKSSRTWLAGAEGERPASASRASIAVLPLANQSGDRGHDYFSDGITEDIIAALGRFSGLMVISHGGVQVYKDRKISAADVSRDLGVRYLVQGSVRQADGKLRVAVELSDAEKGTQLWAERYDGEGKDVFEIQDRIVKNIVGALAVKITGIESQRASAKPVDSLEAYDMVLRARELNLRTERSANREARTLAAEAIRLAPHYAEAHLVLATAEWQRAELGWMEDAAEGVRRSEESANRALAIDDPGSQSRAHGMLGIVYGYRGQFEAALAEADQAMQANPNDADAYALRGSILLWLGKIDDSLAAFAVARRFNPRLSSQVGISIALAHYTAGHYVEALTTVASFISRYPDNTYLLAVRAASQVKLGDLGAARGTAVQIRKLNPFLRAEQFGTRFREPEHRRKIQDALHKAGL